MKRAPSGVPVLTIVIVAAGFACGGGAAPGGLSGGSAAPSPISSTPLRATTLDSFEGIEEPEVLYHPSSASWTPDGFPNITNPSSGLFRFVLRYRPADDWWDGDRTTTNDDRQRAEVKGLGVHQKTGDAFEYATTWRTTRQGSGAFWHVFQLKATDGDSDLPVVVLSIQAGSTAAVRYWPGTAANFIVARSFTYSVGEWTTVRIRIRTSTTSDGYVLASVNGDPFVGVTGVGVYRPGSTDYRPKWGSYRGVDTSQPYGDDTVEQMDISVQRIGG